MQADELAPPQVKLQTPEDAGSDSHKLTYKVLFHVSSI